MKTKIIIEFIVNWLDEYASKAGMDGFVLGISGGIDSAVTSTLCAMTRKKNNLS
jgi:NAD+ synthase